jgi:pimeloyl-ACP methyl ester carboxylesterase
VTGVSRNERFAGAHGNTLLGDVFGDRGHAVLLLHGGGQTRHAWQRTAQAIAGAGMTAYAVDQRGHGDSDWIDSGAYGFADYAADARALADQLAERNGLRPAVAGASLGGVAALMAEGEAARAGQPALFSALVLVDITPRVDHAGIAKVQGFMRCARAGRLCLGGAGRRSGSRVFAASAATPLARGLAQEPAPTSGRPLAVALGSPLP